MMSALTANLPSSSSPLVVIELFGAPIGKGRPKFHNVRTKDGREFVTAYTPATTRAYEKALRTEAWVSMKQARHREAFDVPLSVRVIAVFKPPPSWSNKQYERALAGLILPTGRPDLDNVTKAALDALNQVVWRDDSLIVECFAAKFYGAEPSLRIEVFGMDLGLLGARA